MDPTAATSASSLPQSSTGRFEVRTSALASNDPVIMFRSDPGGYFPATVLQFSLGFSTWSITR